MSEFKDRCFHFYAQVDGTYDWPNSAAGDLLKIGFKEIEQLQVDLTSMSKHAAFLADQLQTTQELRQAILDLEGSEGMTDAKFVKWVIAALTSPEPESVAIYEQRSAKVAMLTTMEAPQEKDNV